MLRYNFYALERAIVFQIVQQDKSFAEFLKKNGGNFTATNGWTITTDNCPELHVEGKTIFLRGEDNTRDLRAHRTWDISSNFERDRIIYEAGKALKELIYAVSAQPTVMWRGEPLAAEASKTSVVGKNTVNNKVVGR